MDYYRHFIYVLYHQSATFKSTIGVPRAKTRVVLLQSCNAVVIDNDPFFVIN